MTEMDASTIAQRYFEETTRRQLSEDLFAADVLFHNYFLARSEVQGIEHVRGAFDLVYSSIPDASVSIHEVLADADKVMVRHTHHGTFAAPFLGLPPTGQPIEFDGVEIFRIADGKIAEFWNFDDNATALRQIGLLEGSPEYRQIVSTLAERARVRAQATG